MSAFEVTITPPTRHKSQHRVETREPTDVIMAPFSAKAIVQFEDVPTTKTAKRILRIINPSEQAIEVKVTKPIKPEHNLTISWMEMSVEALSEVEMEMVWNPQLDVACKETLQLTDNRNFRKDVMIILKSKNNKPPKNTRKFPTISAGGSGVSNTTTNIKTVKTLRLKSPTGGAAKSATTQRKRTAQKTEKPSKNKAATSSASTASKHDKPHPHWNSTVFRAPKMASKRTPADKIQTTIVVTQHNSPLAERNVYLGHISTPTTSDIVDGGDQKENKSPLTPCNVLNLIDKLNFTPATESGPSRSGADLDNLASWPTPVTRDYGEANEDTDKYLRPRRLSASELMAEAEERSEVAVLPNIKLEEESLNDTKSPGVAIIIADKTFEVKLNEAFDLSNDSLDEGRISYGGSVSGGIYTLNKTTTISSTPMVRPLEIIQEEEISTTGTPSCAASVELQKTYCKAEGGGGDDDSAELDLKRDIKLVGTPLRKYSESMRDLSIKSPSQAKMAIQGSLPNLNEMQSIRSIEQNRYFYGSSGLRSEGMSVIHEHNSNKQYGPSVQSSLGDDDSNEGDYPEDAATSRNSLVSHVEFMFINSEILAQSSRFNLNEVGIANSSPSSHRNSPVRGGKPKQSTSENKTKRHTRALSLTSLSTVSSKEPTIKKCASSLLLKLDPMAVGSQKRRSCDLSISESHSNDSIASTCSTTKILNKSLSSGHLHVSPPKRQRIESNNTYGAAADYSFQRPTPANASAAVAARTQNQMKNWSQTQTRKFKLSRTLSLVKKPITPRKTKETRGMQLYDSDLYLQSYINPDPFAATTTSDPFLASTMYLDERAVDRHQTDFRKWLNALVSIPADLEADCNAKIDVGKLFNEVRHKDLTLAPTKEQQSMHYLTTFRLESLRRAAVQLFLSEEMRGPCSKVAVYVQKNAIRIRSDRNLHLDVVMQRSILELLLCFNPLWLRLGLEVVYGEKIHLNSNSDIVGLSTFILNRLFRDKLLEQKYTKAYTLSDEYADHIKKFTLQKMLFLLLFLDTAKSKRIVKHNPCLFSKKSPHKETKEILLRFASEMLANIGDITRDMRRLGYTLQHKQTLLDEFDYAFNNLAVDLRDGVRLTRVMEIILLRDDMSRQLRVPAISRLQRIFNVNLALRALSEADFKLSGDITAADIVDGHREKTLSLLWQIIYKFRSPKFHAAARVLQAWWRHSWLRVCIARRIRHKELLRREAAATKIQAEFRGYIARRYVASYREERTQAALILQCAVRGYLARQHLLRTRSAIVLLQRWWRAQIAGAQCRQQFLLLRNCTVFLQRCLRRRLLARRLMQLVTYAKQLREQRRLTAATRIQHWWHASCSMRQTRIQFLRQRASILTLQRRFRANTAMQHDRKRYLQLRHAAVVVQRRWLANTLMVRERAKYQRLRSFVITLQHRRRATLVMRSVHVVYEQQRCAIINLQIRFRATCAMRIQRAAYKKIRESAINLQRHYRARISMQKQRHIYTNTRNSIICIQRKWRATLLARRTQFTFITMQYHATVLQQKFRARRLMRVQRDCFVELKEAVVRMQCRFRAKQQMRQQRALFQRQKHAALTLQRWWRARAQMRYISAKFQGTRTAAICIQQHVRRYLHMRRERAHFLLKREATVRLQRAYRARLVMRRERIAFVELRNAAISLQRQFRARQQMRKQMHAYVKQRQLIIAVQRRLRATLQMRVTRRDFRCQREAIIKLQRRFRATLKMRSIRTSYLDARAKIISVQRRIRATLNMRRQRESYQKQRAAAIQLQHWRRALIAMRTQRQAYQRQRNATITIQRQWRATVAARQQQKLYQRRVQQITQIQRKWRATLQMRVERSQYNAQKMAAVILQRYYRARRHMLQLRSQYLLIRSLIVVVQRKFRAHRAMLVQRSSFIQLRRATLQVQQRFRARQLGRAEHERYQLLQRSTLTFQAQARGFLARRRLQTLLTPEMMEYLRRRKAVKLIQRFWRGYRVRKRWQRNARILQIRRNIVALRQTASMVDSIRNKVQDAVYILRGRFSASEALHVLKRLERLSRTVPHLLMRHTDFISKFCYGIMAQAIRSEVDKQLIEYCSCIILNLARYNSTTANTFQEGGLVTIAQMLLRWCDKDCEIFNTLCTLIWVFGHCPAKREIIREFMTTQEAIYMVRETKKLVVRKEKMKQNMRKPALVLTRQQQQQQQFSSRALPSLEPDYGVIRNKPYTFISSVYAFDTILCKLGIEIF